MENLGIQDQDFKFKPIEKDFNSFRFMKKFGCDGKTGMDGRSEKSRDVSKLTEDLLRSLRFPPEMDKESWGKFSKNESFDGIKNE